MSSTEIPEVEGNYPGAALRAIPIEQIPRSTLEQLRAMSLTQPWSNGSWALDPVPVVFVRVRDEALARTLARAAKYLLSWNWNTSFGSAISFTLFTMKKAEGNDHAPVFVPYERAWYDQLLDHGRLLVVVGTSKAFFGAFEADFKAMRAEQSTQGLRDNRDFPDVALAHHWSAAVFEVIDHRHRKGALQHLVTPQDHVRIMWARALRVKLAQIEERWKKRDVDVSEAGLSELCAKHAPAVHHILKHYRDHQGEFVDYADGVFALLAENSVAKDTDWHPVVALFADIFEYCTNLSPNQEERSFLDMWHEAALRASRQCDGGRCLPWIDGTRIPWTLNQIELDLAAIARRASDYWARVNVARLVNAGFVLDAADIPISPPDLHPEQLRLADDLNAASAQELIDHLLAEADACRKWSIPWGATVELRAGPFAYAQIFELERDVFVKLLDAHGQYALMCVSAAKKTWLSPFMEWGTEMGADRADLALRILAASVLRDFLVIENRESVFGGRQGIVPGQKRHGSRYIYLPRVRYTSRPNLEAAERELHLAQRAPHFVAPHLRRAMECSEQQRRLARAYGFTVPPGFTFVRKHRRGVGAQPEEEVQRIYRSRSALAAMYETVEGVIGGVAEWFRFEKDVLRLMKRLGFRVEHISCARREDGGVDIYAISDDEKEAWAVQCKCWRIDRPVGPDVIRELHGALHKYPEGTKGMVVTTSRFTSGAAATALQLGILLLDGQEFARLAEGDHREAH